MLRFENVTFTYESADAPVISDLSFEVPDKSFVSIIGASGSGKTTIFRLLNALERPQSGNITIDGKDIKGLKNYAGYMPQQDLLFPWRAVERNVMLPMQIKKVSKAEQKEKAREMLERVGLLEYADKYPRELSGGMRQRVSFARTLCEGSDLMLLDEPFSALDSITRMEMREWLRDQWERLDKTILFITHDVEEALYLSEKIFVLMGNPVNRLKCVDVPLPKNRDAAMLKREDIRQLKEELVELLRKEASE